MYEDYVDYKKKKKKTSVQFIIFYPKYFTKVTCNLNVSSFTPI